MKKKIVLLLASAGLLAASCAVQKNTPDPPPPDTTKEVVVKRNPANGIEGRFILHFVGNSAQGTNKNYHLVHDYPNKYFHILDEDTTYRKIKNYIPDTLRVVKNKLVIRSVTIESTIAYSFSSFTKDVLEKIATTQGMRFDLMNDYRLSKSKNAQEEKDDPEAMMLLLNMLQGKSTIVQTATPGRAPIEGAEGMLLKHPIRDQLVGINGKYDTYYDLPHGYIYMTPDTTLYAKFSAALPLEETGIKNGILVQGAAADPVILLKQESLDHMTKDEGLQINGGGDIKKSINAITIARLSGYLIVYDYPEVISWLQRKLKIKNTELSESTTNEKNTPAKPPVKIIQKKSNDPNRPFDPNE